MGELVLSDLWEGLGDDSSSTEDRRVGVLAELVREVVDGHPLWGRMIRVEAFFGPADDVIVLLDDGTYALVHPTWTLRPERLPWPETELLGPAAEATAQVEEWEQLWRD